MRLPVCAALCLAVAAGRATAQVVFGGELRARFESIDNEGWKSAEAEDTGLLRILLSADWRPAPRWRLFAQLKAAVEGGRLGGPRSTDEDRLDVHQAFADLTAGALTFRLGRHELVFGSSRLVSNRKGPNVPRSFDGLSVLAGAGAWKLQGFATEPAKTRRGVFDDSPDRTSKFWGLYAVGPLRVLREASVDLYYLGLDRDQARYDQGAAPELRETAGTRIWRTAAPWDYDFELVYQWGRFGTAPIRAWTVASDSGYTWKDLAWQPRLGLKADVTSGDRDPSDPRLQTFHPLFPRGAYFGEAALIGPQNHVDLHPSIEVKPLPRLSVNASWIFFWRESTHDGLYDIAGRVLRSGKGSGARYVGSQPALIVTARLGQHVTLVADLEYFLAGPYLRETGGGEDLTFLASWVTITF